MRSAYHYLAFGRPDFSALEIDAVHARAALGMDRHGPEMIAFEQELAAAVGAPHVVSVDTCTSATSSPSSPRALGWAMR